MINPKYTTVMGRAIARIRELQRMGFEVTFPLGGNQWR